MINEDEFMRQMSAQLRAPDMISQTAVDPDMLKKASRTFKAEDRRIKAQQDYANMLRGKAAPTGKTVGSGIYVAPNWAEALEYGLNQGLGGYMAGKAQRDDMALDPARQEAAEAMLAIERADKERTLGQSDRRLDLTQRGLEDTMARHVDTHGLATDRFGHQQRQDEINNLFKEQGLALTAAATESQPYLDPAGNIRNITKAFVDGGLVNVDEKSEPVDITGWKQIAAPTSKSGAGFTPKYPETFYKPDGTLQETVMIGGERINVGGDNDGEKFDRTGWRPAMEAGKVASELSKFETKTAKTAQLAGKFNIANEVMRRHGIDIFGGEGALGVLQNDAGFVSGVVRNLSDFEDQQAAEVYSAMRDTINQIVRTEAGLSQTKTEIENIQNVYGLNWYDNPQVLAKAWPRLQKHIHNDIKRQVGSTHGQVMAEYRMNLQKEGAADWTKIGVGLSEEMPPKWYDTDQATMEEKALAESAATPMAPTTAATPMAPATVEDINNMTEEELDVFIASGGAG